MEPRLFGSNRDTGKAGGRRRRRRSLFGGLLSLGFTLAIWGVILGGVAFGYVWFTLDQKGLFQVPAREPGIMLLASNGDVLAERGSFFGDEVRLDELPAYVPEAVMAIEDKRFRGHFGIDPVGLFRAMVENFRAGHVVQGGSTLTQQLAKNLFLKPERTMERKVQEAVLALWLEHSYSKDDILQLYLNRVYFGGGAVGIEKAAQKFFGKSARDVTLAEAAILAAVLKAPADYNPLIHPKEANARAALVISEMVDAGFISAEEASLAISNPVEVKAADYVPATQYIVDYATDMLPQLVKSYDQSIVIWTTIDPDIQANAEKAMRTRLAAEGVKLGISQGALVTLDPDGAVKAMVGGKSYAKSQFNRATRAKRQPGSSFKPFVYLAALEHGFSPDSVEVDEPVRFGDWEPENYRQKYLGPVTLTKALALSLNAVAAKLVMKVTPEAAIAVARRLGITSDLAPNASLALGTSEVTPLEMTAAFTAFSNGGVPVQPYLVTRITTRSGDTLYERKGSGLGQAITSLDLGAMNDMMRAVVAYGTGKGAQFGNFDIAGKTGTSQDYRDAWFIGYTTYFTTGVWLGNDDNSPTKKVTGGSLPTTIWKDVMVQAHSGLVPMPLPGEHGLPEEGTPVASAREIEVGQNEDGGGGFFDRLFGGGGRSHSEPQRKSKTRDYDPSGASAEAVKARALNNR